MVPIHYNEITYTIGKRIKMILSRNLNLTYITIYINLQKTKIKVILDFLFLNKEYNYTKVFIINKNMCNKNEYINEYIIERIILDLEKQYNLN